MNNTALVLADIAGLLLRYNIAITDYKLTESKSDNSVEIKITGDVLKDESMG